MTTTTRTDVRRSLDTLIRAAKDAGYPLPDALSLDIGSKLYGRAYRLFSVGERGEHHNIHLLGLSNGYLGMTAAEACHTLRTLANVLWGIASVNHSRAQQSQSA